MVSMIKIIAASLLLSDPSMPMSAQTPSVPASVRAQVQVKLTTDGFAPVEIDRENAFILFSATANGKPVRVLLDNGVGISLIDTRLVEALGLRTTPVPGGQIQAASGELKPQIRVEGVEFSIPNQLEMNTQMLSMDLSPISSSISRDVDIVMGGEFFNNFSISLRSSESDLRIKRSGEMQDEMVSALLMEPGGIVSVTVNGRPVRLQIDLGFNGFVHLSDNVWTQVARGSVTEMSDQITLFGSRRVSQYQRAEVRIGDVTVEGPVSTSLDATICSDCDGLLGYGFFKNINVVFDQRAQSLTMSPS